jgi:hypothetical protein
VWGKIVIPCLAILAFVMPARANDVLVSLTTLGDGTIVLDGRFPVQAPAAVAWDVLTDYDHIHDFVSSMERSRIRSRTGDHLFVEQKASAHYFLFARSAHVMLSVRESPDESIYFEDVSHQDFNRYLGYWSIDQVQNGVLVFYHLEVKSRFVVPGFIKRRVVKGSVTELLDQVRLEIKKRAEQKRR